LRSCQYNGRGKTRKKINQGRLHGLKSETVSSLINRHNRYQQLRARLLELDLQRQKQQRCLAQYKQLEVLLTAFKDPSKNIQPNLVTRDGELGQELDRMRMLVARVAGRVGQSRQMHQIEDPTTILPGDPNQKLAAVLDMAP
jgi:DNA-binding SARP family transcriptional activator